MKSSAARMPVTAGSQSLVRVFFDQGSFRQRAGQASRMYVCLCLPSVTLLWRCVEVAFALEYRA